MLNEHDLFLYYQKEGENKHQFAVDCKSRFHLKRYITSGSLLRKYGREGVVLDVGSAEGWTAKWASEVADFVVGLEISLPKLKRAVVESSAKNNGFVLGSFDHMPFRDRVFDVVIWFEGPEHAVNPSAVIARVCELLKDSGVLTISTMGLRPPLSYHFIMKLSREWDTYLASLHGWGHVSLFTKRSLLTLLIDENRLLLKESIFVGPKLIVLYELASRMASLFNMNLEHLPWPGFGCIIYVVSKKTRPAESVTEDDLVAT